MLPTIVSDGTITDYDYDVLLRYELIRERTAQGTDLNPSPPRFTLYGITKKGKIVAEE